MAKMYDTMLEEQAKAMGVSAVPVEEEEGGKGSTDGDTIYVNREFFSDIEDRAGEGGVRFILAHELGHIEHGMAGGPEAELECDEFGARSIAATGFGAGAIRNVMGALNQTATETHPGAAERTQRALSAYGKVASFDELEGPKPERRITRFPRQR
jgi:hypothetical protein